MTRERNNSRSLTTERQCCHSFFSHFLCHNPFFFLSFIALPLCSVGVTDQSGVSEALVVTDGGPKLKCDDLRISQAWNYDTWQRRCQTWPHPVNWHPRSGHRMREEEGERENKRERPGGGKWTTKRFPMLFIYRCIYIHSHTLGSILLLISFLCSSTD